MTRHQGLLIDVQARTQRGRDGHTAPLDALVPAGNALYIAGPLPWNARFAAFERWLLPARGWVVGRFTHRPGQRPMSEDWYIDLDWVTVSGDRWQVHDGLLDVAVYERRRSEVHDADELAEALERGEITLAEALVVLRALHDLCRALERLDFSGAALLREYAPGLPA